MTTSAILLYTIHIWTTVQVKIIFFLTHMIDLHMFSKVFPLLWGFCNQQCKLLRIQGQQHDARTTWMMLKKCEEHSNSKMAVTSKLVVVTKTQGICGQKYNKAASHPSDRGQLMPEEALPILAQAKQEPPSVDSRFCHPAKQASHGESLALFLHCLL